MGALVHGLLRCDLAGLHRLPPLVVHIRGDRLHNDDGQEKRQPQQHLVGRRGLRSQRLPQEMEHHGDAQERRDTHDGCGKQRHQCQQNDDLHGNADAGTAFSGRYAEEREGFDS